MCSRLICNVFFFGVLLLGACGSEDDDPGDCPEGATQGCLCAGGDNGAQVCDNGAWGACECGATTSCTDGSSQACTCAGDVSGSQTCSGGFWQGCECASGGDDPVVGDPCFGPNDCSGGDLPLFCVVENGGDIQGICTISCGDWADCLGDPVPSFYDCCDLSNGSLACAPDGWECRGE